MKFTFNWGHGIFAFYTVFAGVLFFSVYKSTQHNNTLVVEDYYAQDLAYQGQYERLQNSLNLPEKVKINWQSANKTVHLAFPDEVVNPTGTVAFYRPDNKDLDWQMPLRLDTLGQMDIDLSRLPAGRWKLQCIWDAEGTPYFDEKTLDIR